MSGVPPGVDPNSLNPTSWGPQKCHVILPYFYPTVYNNLVHVWFNGTKKPINYILNALVPDLFRKCYSVQCVKPPLNPAFCFDTSQNACPFIEKYY